LTCERQPHRPVADCPLFSQQRVVPATLNTCKGILRPNRV
jgi:hypothetical protein